MPEVASWAYQGNGRRYFDFLVYGDPVLNTGAEREFHHYGAPLNARPLLGAVMRGEAMRPAVPVGSAWENAEQATPMSDGEVATLAVALGGVVPFLQLRGDGGLARPRSNRT